MEFKSVKYLSLAASISLLTACGGGGGSSSGSGGASNSSDSPRAAYSGTTQPASLELSNRYGIIRIFYGSIATNYLYTEELELSDLISYAASQMRRAGIREVDESENCSSGSVKVEVTTNSAYEDFSYNLDYRNCSEGGATTDGTLKGKFEFENAYYYNDPSYLKVTYDNFTLESNDIDISLIGTETSRQSSGGNGFTNSRNVLFKASNGNESGERLFDNIKLEQADLAAWKYGGIVSLSGNYLDNFIGEIGLSIEDSELHDGTAVIFTGANNSTLVVDYNDTSGLVEISLDSDGDSVVDNLDTMTISEFDDILYP